MGMNAEPVWLTYAEAARRVKRDARSIRTWRRNGMVMEWRVDELGQRYRAVEESVLLAWFRQTLRNSPVHHYRMRRAAIERGKTPPPLPERFTLTHRTPAESRTKRDSTPVTASGAPERPGTPQVGSESVLDDTEVANSGHLTPEPGGSALADLLEFRGQTEHAALVRAMEHKPPACDGLDVCTRDRFNDPEELELMRGICRECPLLEMCRAFAVAGRPSAGTSAGMTPAQIRRLPLSEAGATLAA